MECLNPHLRQLVYSSVVAVVSICGQFTTVLMATEVPSEPKAQWNAQETDALLAHLFSNLSEAGDGNNFKAVTYTSAVATLAAANLLTAGPPKTAKCCKTKWMSLRQMFGNIENYRSLSGVHWDSERGAGIEGEAAWAVWNAYIQLSYHNAGWPFYSQVQAILPHGHGAQGHHAFHPAVAAPAPLVNNEPNDEALSQLTVAGITLHDTLTLVPHTSTTVDSSTAIGSASISFAIPHLPVGPPSIAGSSLSKGKRTHDDALLEVETSSYVSSHPSYSTPVASSTLVSTPSAAKKPRSARVTSSCATSSRIVDSTTHSLMTSATKASKLTAATAVVGMQGSINRIGDILEKAVTTAQAPAPAPRPITPPATSKIKELSVIERAMHIMQMEDTDMPAEDLGILMTIFSAVDTRRSFIRGLVAAHKAALQV
ncbi:hypothetical protein EDB19DRAFT_1909155 [Suillus lakei]|nr:hypothetical protein EDB19DRAFT_1909155 [Suillus lakei]